MVSFPALNVKPPTAETASALAAWVPTNPTREPHNKSAAIHDEAIDAERCLGPIFAKNCIIEQKVN